MLRTSANPLGDTTTYAYTADTLEATVTNANGHVTTNTYFTCCVRLEKVPAARLLNPQFSGA